MSRPVSYDVRIHTIRHRPDRRRPYEVRWNIGKMTSRSRSFLTRGLADSFRAELVSAARAGEGFDVESGLPQRMTTQRRTGPTWFEHAVAYAAKKWPRLSPNSRAATAEALSTLTPALVRSQRGAPPAAELRAALYGWAFNAGRGADEQPPQVRRALAWMAKASVPVAALDQDRDLVTRALDALALTLDGRPAAANTVRRKRAVFYNALRYGVEKRLLPANPIDVVQWTLPKTDDAVDRRVVANPGQARALLAAVEALGDRGGHLKAFFGGLYFAALRPAEAVALTRDTLTLPAPVLRCPDCGPTTAAGAPADGTACPSCGGTHTTVNQDWGQLALTASEPRVGRTWSNSGTVHERRQLKHRARHAVRAVPIPPEYVTMLRDHLAAYGVDADGRLFRSARGRPVQESEYGRMWAAARHAALNPDQVASPLARRPYDLRHAGVSLWLRSGVDATEVARRAGHTVDVLLRVYAGILDGIETESNRRIQAALDPDTNKTG